jgi:hypothetical protein
MHACADSSGPGDQGGECSHPLPAQRGKSAPHFLLLYRTSRRLALPSRACRSTKPLVFFAITYAQFHAPAFAECGPLSLAELHRELQAVREPEPGPGIRSESHTLAHTNTHVHKHACISTHAQARTLSRWLARSHAK